ncbi:high mobility group B3 [Rhynchospora pubera]|uniref:High mobility group B3 n=1 Tax=Rhynchospora pubera TaxID=906938 RepID=A0AAV8I0F3_9POAL|nr:high mobility group B3 [Rhynchospora pubera]
MKTRSRSTQESSAHKSLSHISHSNSNSKPRKKNKNKKQAQHKSPLKVKDDPHKPKKPPTAFFFYLYYSFLLSPMRILSDFALFDYSNDFALSTASNYFRKTFQQENPTVKSMRQIGKACGDKWKTLSFEEKVAYYDIATEKRAEFERAMAEYVKRQENGELSDESEDELR